MFFEDLNFLNFPAIRFKRPKQGTLASFYAEIFKKFKEDEDAGQVWEQRAYDALIKDDKEEIARLEKEGGKIIFIDEVIDILIDKYMMNGGISDEEAESHKQTILKGGYIKDIEFKHNPEQIVFKSKIGTFKASKFSDVFPIFKQIEELGTSERHSKCHSASIDLSTVIEDENRVATGYVYTFGEGSKFLHSWIEVKFDGRMFVIDTTRNLFMPRKFYYYIRNIRGPVYKISSETLIKDEAMRDELSAENEWLNKLYLSNRHQAIQVYKMIQKEKERKKMQDPLYVAAKHFRESMVKVQRQEERKKQKAKTEDSQLHQGWVSAFFVWLFWI